MGTSDTIRMRDSKSSFSLRILLLLYARIGANKLSYNILQ